jgi:hypothetical protein
MVWGQAESSGCRKGKKVIRILSEARMAQSVYEGQPNTKFVTRVIDRKDSKLRGYYMPKTVLEAMSAYETTSSSALGSCQCLTTSQSTPGRRHKDVAYHVLPGKMGALTADEAGEFKPQEAE